MPKLRFSISSPRWPKIKVPSFSLVSAVRVPGMVNLGRFIPRLAIRVGGTKALLAVLLVVTGGFGATVFMVVERTTEHTPLWPEAGAEYTLPSTIGRSLPPDPTAPADISHTLQVTLGATGARVDELFFKNLSLGKAGLTDCVSIERTSGTGWLYVDEFKLINVSAPSFDFGNAEIGTMTLAGSVDGHTQSATLDATISDVTIASSRGAGNFVADGGSVDHIVITTTNDTDVVSLTFENVHCSVGGWDLDYIRAGTFSQDAASRFGDGDGINTADYVINTTVSYRTSTDALIDTPVNVR
jgi:hypothetical protein